MNPKVRDVRRLLPSLILGVFITLLAALCNYIIYDRRLPAMAVGNRVLSGELDNDGNLQLEERRTNRPILRGLAAIVNMADDMATDTMYAIRGPGDYPPTKDKIAVVAIDEASIIRHGSWPWSRSDIARLMEKVNDARVVGMDLVFSDPDRTSLVNYIERFDALHGNKLDLSGADPESLDNDLLLARHIVNARTVLGAILYNGVPPGNLPKGMKNSPAFEVVFFNGTPAPPENVLLKKNQWALGNLPSIRDIVPQPQGEGFINLFPAPNGVVRTVPLFVHVSDQAFSVPSGHPRRIAPSLPLEVLRVYLNCDGYRINLRGDKVNIPEFRDPSSNGDRYAVQSVCLLRNGSEVMRIPLSELGELEVGLRNHRRDYTIYPAWEVLEGMHDDAFQDKMTLIGGTVPGVGMLVSTGLPGPEMSVAEAHAAMLSGMLKGDFMDSGYQDDYSWQQIAILASGLAVTVAIIFGDLVGGMIVSATAMLLIILCNYFLFFRRGMDVGITLPIISVLTVLAVLMATNYMVVGRERRFIRKAFQLNVSPSILGYLESHPDRLSSLQGEHRHMTVLFSDIRAFTTMSERMTAPDLARFLNEYFTPMSDVVMKNMGTVDKFIGDGMMAFWNAPADNPHHARDAARSALDMLSRLEELQHGWTMRGLPQVSIGCGINTGPMFAGYMGSEQRKNYTVMGDSVNIASRLENLNKMYSSSILITESTREELNGDFVYRVVDKVRVSGKAEALLIYELLGMGAVSEERSEELAAFSRVFELYQQREFVTAESLLKELVFIRPAPLYKMYLDRLAIYKALPPPADWDGTFSMTHK